MARAARARARLGPATAGIASDYYPAVVGKPSGTIVGRLIDIGFGNGSGSFDVRTSDGRMVAFYAGAPPFVVDGVRVECPIVPLPGPAC